MIDIKRYTVFFRENGEHSFFSFPREGSTPSTFSILFISGNYPSSSFLILIQPSSPSLSQVIILPHPSQSSLSQIIILHHHPSSSFLFISGNYPSSSFLILTHPSSTFCILFISGNYPSSSFLTLLHPLYLSLEYFIIILSHPSSSFLILPHTSLSIPNSSSFPHYSSFPPFPYFLITISSFSLHFLFIFNTFFSNLHILPFVFLFSILSYPLIIKIRETKLTVPWYLVLD